MRSASGGASDEPLRTAEKPLDDFYRRRGRERRIVNSRFLGRRACAPRLKILTVSGRSAAFSAALAILEKASASGRMEAVSRLQQAAGASADGETDLLCDLAV
jgi:hypothetical protein